MNTTVCLLAFIAICALAFVYGVVMLRSGAAIDAKCRFCSRPMLPYQQGRRWLETADGRHVRKPWPTILAVRAVSVVRPSASRLEPVRYWCRRCDRDDWQSPDGRMLKLVVLTGLLGPALTVLLVLDVLGFAIPSA